MMKDKRLWKSTLVAGPVLAALILAGTLFGCAADPRPENGQQPTPATAALEISGMTGGEAQGEHGSGEEASGMERSGEGAGAGTGSEEATGATLAPGQTFDQVRSGARLVLNYDPNTNAFAGTVENTTGNTLNNVRIEVHLSNGAELGPTMPVDLAPSQVMDVNLPATGAFSGWIAHAEVGSGAETGQSDQSGPTVSGEVGGIESGPDGPEGPERGSSGEAAQEAAITATEALERTRRRLRRGEILVRSDLIRFPDNL